MSGVPMPSGKSGYDEIAGEPLPSGLLGLIDSDAAKAGDQKKSEPGKGKK